MRVRYAKHGRRGHRGGGHRRRGFAMILAITLLGLVAATLAMLATHFAGEATRTRTQAAEAQGRQILTAGAMIARENGELLAAGKPVNVQLPQSLAQGGAKLIVTGKPDAVQLEAEVAGHRTSEVLKMSRQGAGWKIVGVEVQAQ